MRLLPTPPSQFKRAHSEAPLFRRLSTSLHSITSPHPKHSMAPLAGLLHGFATAMLLTHIGIVGVWLHMKIPSG